MIADPAKPYAKVKRLSRTVAFNPSTSDSVSRASESCARIVGVKSGSSSN